ncbi:50S ribosomal protein L6 [Candidatus Gottesmanbacteria bacterium]|nr:50S ribosomal protein L6 [Candidatus Gottesmanbacteria bacterium]
MTRIGRKPISFENDVKISQNMGIIYVEGPVGKMELPVPSEMEVKISGNTIEIAEKNGVTARNIQGLFRSLLQNAVTGVKTQWNKTLELVGVGYRAQTSGTELELNLGFSHPIKMKAPMGITFKVVENKIIVSGADKYMVGEVSAIIRKLKPPEPYKGKGIRYDKEFIRKKLGKAAKAVGATGAK